MNRSNRDRKDESNGEGYADSHGDGHGECRNEAETVIVKDGDELIF